MARMLIQVSSRLPPRKSVMKESFSREEFLSLSFSSGEEDGGSCVTVVSGRMVWRSLQQEEDVVAAAVANDNAVEGGMAECFCFDFHMKSSMIAKELTIKRRGISSDRTVRARETGSTRHNKSCIGFTLKLTP